MDMDAAFMSKFFYYDPRSDLVYAGPIWDMDHILGSNDRFSIRVLTSGRRFVWNWGKESLFYRLSQKDSFHQTVIRLYREEFRPLLLELVEMGMDQYLLQIQTARFLNSIRWDIRDAEDMTGFRKDTLLGRIGFLDEYLGYEDEYCMISLITIYDDQWRSFAVRRGETADFLISQGITWLDYETGEPFDITVPVMEDWVIYQTE